MTLAENVALPLEEYKALSPRALRAVVSLKLALVGLAGFEDFYPFELSGGMRKRAALARAMALDPDMLFFDEPSAGLDPLSSRRLDDLIRIFARVSAPRSSWCHELASIYHRRQQHLLDTETKTMLAVGNPEDAPGCLARGGRAFLRQGGGHNDGGCRNPGPRLGRAGGRRIMGNKVSPRVTVALWWADSDRDGASVRWEQIFPGKDALCHLLRGSARGLNGGRPWSFAGSGQPMAK